MAWTEDESACPKEASKHLHALMRYVCRINELLLLN